MDASLTDALLSLVLLVWMLCAMIMHCLSFPQGESFAGGKGEQAKEDTVAFPSVYRSASPEHYDKANLYARKFDASRKIFWGPSTLRVKKRAYDDMLMAAAKAMKHANWMRMAFPNDLELETEFHRRKDALESRMHRNLEAAAREAFRDGTDVYKLDNVQLHAEPPFAYNKFEK